MKEEFLKIYIDSNLISDLSKVVNFKQEEIDALEELSEDSKLKFYTSEKTKREIDKYQNLKKQGYLKFIYSWLNKIPEKNIIEFIPATFNSVAFNEATFNGGANSEDLLFTNLKQFFDKDDAEHIFQAEKNKLDYFLTLDEKTILNRIKREPDRFKKLHLKIQIVLPSQLVNKLKSMYLPNEKI
jgi:predicted nucleic acid-binding protein